jgi:hypothetical protein
VLASIPSSSPIARTFLATSHSSGEAWHTFLLACQYIALDTSYFHAEHCLAQPVGLVHSPSLLPCEQYINNTIGLALLHKPSARFLHPEARHASSVEYQPMPSFEQLLDC